jgi:hypothetical protein
MLSSAVVVLVLTVVHCPRTAVCTAVPSTIVQPFGASLSALSMLLRVLLALVVLLVPMLSFFISPTSGIVPFVAKLPASRAVLSSVVGALHAGVALNAVVTLRAVVHRLRAAVWLLALFSLFSCCRPSSRCRRCPCCRHAPFG